MQVYVRVYESSRDETVGSCSTDTNSSTEKCFLPLSCEFAETLNENALSVFFGRQESERDTIIIAISYELCIFHVRDLLEGKRFQT